MDGSSKNPPASTSTKPAARHQAHFGTDTLCIGGGVRIGILYSKGIEESFKHLDKLVPNRKASCA